jgi:hypothetical protein
MGEGRKGPTGADRRRLTVPEAAEALGITVDAVRGRVRRKKLRSENENGTVYVWVDAPEHTDRRGPSEASQRPSADQSERIEDLKEQVDYLRRQLDEEREARRRADLILGQLSQANAEQARTIRALEAPREFAGESEENAPEDAETVEEAPEGSEPRPATGGVQEATERPGFWRRLFGG